MRKTTLLNDLVHQSRLGNTIDEMVCLLADDDSETAEALEYINQLIDFQFLTSEMDVTVSGSDEWDAFFQSLIKFRI